MIEEVAGGHTYEQGKPQLQGRHVHAPVRRTEHGILAEYLTDNASEVFNMLLQDWNWEDAKTVWQREAEERGEERERAKLQPILADKDAEIAALKAKINMN